jgi:nucleoside-diphosphate-sugar epimerase
MPRRVFLTGGAGFVGGATARLLRTMGDEVVAVVRDPSKAGPLRDIGATVVAGDLSSPDAIREAMAGSDAVIHAAGSYRIGIPEAARPAMYEANVAVTERVLDAAIDLGIPRIVDISTVNTFGNTGRRVPDETFERDPSKGFLSYYDETKYLAHRAARQRIDAGAPIVIVLPGTVYGRGDHSAAGAQLEAAFNGTLPYYGPGEMGLSPTYVDDLAAGIVTALDRGRVGESYVMAGENMRFAEAIAIAARAGGHRPPRLRVPTTLLRLAGTLLPNGGRLAGQPPNLREIVRASAGITYWASSEKAETELGYRSRPLAAGAVAAFGRL